MRAQQVVELGKPYELRDVERPEPGKGELLLKTKCAGLCHTDGMVRCDGFGGAKLPLTGSHEPSGIVEAVGEGVTRFKKGDRVGAVGTMADGTCADCKAGHRVFCDNADFVGLGRHGAFADYVVVSAASAFPVPDELEFSQVAPITCAGLTIFNAIQRADLPKGGLLAISGLGALGHFGVAIAKVLGLRVVGVDVKKDALELARGLKFAPDLVIDANKPSSEAVQEIKRKFGDDVTGVDAAIIATDAIPSYQFGTDILRKHGTLIVVGQPSDPIPLKFVDVIFKDITVKGSLLGESSQAEELARLMVKHGVEFTVRTFKLEDLNKAVDASHDATGKAVIVFD